MKRTLLILGASLTIAVPTFVAADGLVTNEKGANNLINLVTTPAVVQQDSSQAGFGDCTGADGNGAGRGGQMGMKHGRGQGMKGMRQGQGGNFEERKIELLGLAEKYSPDTVKEWTDSIAERDSLKEKWQSAEFAEARQSFMEEQQAAMEVLRDQVAAGEITRDEMREKMLEQKGNAEFRALYTDLQAAVDAGQKDEAKKLLEQMLQQFKERNKELQKRLDTVKK